MSIAATDGEIFVGNQNGGSVSEFNARSARFVRVMRLSTRRFYGGTVVTVASSSLIVGVGNLVAEVDAATGKTYRIIRDSAYHFAATSLLVKGGDMFVSNFGDTVAELDVKSGRLIRVFAGHRYHFSLPIGMSITRGDLFVINQLGDSVTDIDVATGKVLHIIDSGGGDCLWQPASLATIHGVVVVLSGRSGCVSEVAAATGKVVRFLRGPKYRFGFGAVTAFGFDMFCTNRTLSEVTEVNEPTGRIVRYVTS